MDPLSLLHASPLRADDAVRGGARQPRDALRRCGRSALVVAIGSAAVVLSIGGVTLGLMASRATLAASSEVTHSAPPSPPATTPAAVTSPTATVPVVEVSAAWCSSSRGTPPTPSRRGSTRRAYPSWAPPPERWLAASSWRGLRMPTTPPSPRSTSTSSPTAPTPSWRRHRLRRACGRALRGLDGNGDPGPRRPPGDDDHADHDRCTRAPPPSGRRRKADRETHEKTREGTDQQQRADGGRLLQSRVALRASPMGERDGAMTRTREADQ